MKDLNEIKDLLDKTQDSEEVKRIIRELEDEIAINNPKAAKAVSATMPIELSDEDLDKVNGGIDLQAAANLIVKYAFAKLNTLIGKGSMAEVNKEETILDKFNKKDIM